MKQLIFLLILLGLAKPISADYYLVKPGGEVYPARRTQKGYEVAGMTQIFASEAKMQFIDTVFWHDETSSGWYYPDRDSNTVCIQYFNSEYPCSLVAVGINYYSAGWAHFYVWDGPNPLPATTGELETHLYDTWEYDDPTSTWVTMPTILFEDSIGTDDPPDDGVERTAWVDITPKLDLGTSYVLVGYRILDRTHGGEPYGGKPWPISDGWYDPLGRGPHWTPCRTWMFRVQETSPLHLQWIDYGNITGDWEFYYVIDLYGYDFDPRDYDKLLGTYDTGDRSVTAWLCDYGVPAESCGVREAWLFYYLNDDSATLDSTEMVLVDGTIVDGTWEATIPGQPPETRITYYITGVNIRGFTLKTDCWSYYVGRGHPGHIFFHIGLLADYGPHDPVAAVRSMVDVWNEGVYGVADSTVLEYYITGPGEKGIIWLDWTGTSMLQDTAGIRRFLDAGGSLLLSSQDLPADFGLADDPGEPYGHWTANPLTDPFAYDYLRLRSGIDDYRAIDTLSSFPAHGVPGDSITGSLEQISVTPAHNWTGILDSVSAGSNEIFFGPDSEIIGSRYEGNHKLVFLYWHFHEIGTGGRKQFEPDTGSQNEFIRNALRWLGLTVRVDGRPVAGERTNAFLETHPNPFSPQTTIRYSLTKAGRITLKVYNALGQEARVLVDEFQHAGTYSVVWNSRDNSGRKVSSGTYFLRLEAGEYTAMRKVCVVR